MESKVDGFCLVVYFVLWYDTVLRESRRVGVCSFLGDKDVVRVVF